MPFTYIIKCGDGSLYTGVCVSVKERMRDHYYKTDMCAKYTRYREIISLEALWKSENLSSACKLEACIKKLKKPQKNELIKNPHKLGKVYGVHLSEIKYEYIKDVSLGDFITIEN